MEHSIRLISFDSHYGIDDGVANVGRRGLRREFASFNDMSRDAIAIR